MGMQCLTRNDSGLVIVTQAFENPQSHELKTSQFHESLQRIVNSHLSKESSTSTVPKSLVGRVAEGSSSGNSQEDLLLELIRTKTKIRGYSVEYYDKTSRFNVLGLGTIFKRISAYFRHVILITGQGEIESLLATQQTTAETVPALGPKPLPLPPPTSPPTTPQGVGSKVPPDTEEENSFINEIVSAVGDADGKIKKSWINGLSPFFTTSGQGETELPDHLEPSSEDSLDDKKDLSSLLRYLIDIEKGTSAEEIIYGIVHAIPSIVRNWNQSIPKEKRYEGLNKIFLFLNEMIDRYATENNKSSDQKKLMKQELFNYLITYKNEKDVQELSVLLGDFIGEKKGLEEFKDTSYFETEGIKQSVSQLLIKGIKRPLFSEIEEVKNRLVSSSFKIEFLETYQTPVVFYGLLAALPLFLTNEYVPVEQRYETLCDLISYLMKLGKNDVISEAIKNFLPTCTERGTQTKKRVLDLYVNFYYSEYPQCLQEKIVCTDRKWLLDGELFKASNFSEILCQLDPSKDFDKDTLNSESAEVNLYMDLFKSLQQTYTSMKEQSEFPDMSLLKLMGALIKKIYPENEQKQKELASRMIRILFLSLEEAPSFFETLHLDSYGRVPSSSYPAVSNLFGLTETPSAKP